MTEFDERLRAAIDETERVAQDAAGLGTSGRAWRRDLISCVESADGSLIVYGEGTPTSGQADHIARHDPASVLRVIEAHRTILDLHRIEVRPPLPGISPEYACVICDYDREDGLCYGPEVACPTVMAIAAAYEIQTGA